MEHKKSAFLKRIIVLAVATGSLLTITGHASAATINCPDGYDTGVSGPIAAQDRQDICRGHTVSGKASSPATSSTSGSGDVNLGDMVPPNVCGGSSIGNTQIHTSINFGCQGKGNALLDLIFALVRFLSAGAGIVVVASLVYAGIQYSASRGDPNATVAAMKRVQNTAVALLIYIFAFAIINYIVPSAFLK